MACLQAVYTQEDVEGTTRYEREDMNLICSKCNESLGYEGDPADGDVHVENCPCVQREDELRSTSIRTQLADKTKKLADNEAELLRVYKALTTERNTSIETWNDAIFKLTALAGKQAFAQGLSLDELIVMIEKRLETNARS